MKIRRFTEFQKRIPYLNFDSDYESIYSGFLSTRLGQIYQAFPWQALVDVLGLKENRKGPRSIFSPKGKLGLMFLKHYAACSDLKLIEQLNANLHYQIFCDIVISSSNPITNYKIVSEIRCELSKLLCIDEIQQILAETWKPYMKSLDSMCCDATCYETWMRYPTDIKLLWEGVRWNYKALKSISKKLEVKLP